MTLTKDEVDAIAVSLGRAAADGESNENKAIARGDFNEAKLAAMFASECKRLAARFRLARGSLSDITQSDGEIIVAALRATAGVWQQRADARPHDPEKMKQLAFAAAFHHLADRVVLAVGRAPALKH